MLEFDRIRKLHPELNELSDSELKEAVDALYGFAQLAFDIWNGSKNPVRVLTTHIVESWMIYDGRTIRLPS